MNSENRNGIAMLSLKVWRLMEREVLRRPALESGAVASSKLSYRKPLTGGMIIRISVGCSVFFRNIDRVIVALSSLIAWSSNGGVVVSWNYFKRYDHITTYLCDKTDNMFLERGYTVKEFSYTLFYSVLINYFSWNRISREGGPQSAKIYVYM